MLLLVLLLVLLPVFLPAVLLDVKEVLLAESRCVFDSGFWRPKAFSTCALSLRLRFSKSSSSVLLSPLSCTSLVNV